MNKSKVVAVLCDSYDEELVYNAVKAGVNALAKANGESDINDSHSESDAHGITKFISQNENILVKPNFLVPSGADKAVTTHPYIISAVLRLLNEAGCNNVHVGDSPANGSSKGAISKLGLTEEMLHGATIAEMNHEETVRFKEGKTAKQFHFAKEVTEADAIIGLSKMKTHMLERVTGAVKNMYGLICGYRKAAGHVKYPTAVKFAKMMADMHRATPQRLHIMDGIVAMEGNGPASGVPVNMGVILLSTDPVALDSVFCKMVFLSPKVVPTNVWGQKYGIGTCDESKIELTVIKDYSSKYSKATENSNNISEIIGDNDKSYGTCKMTLDEFAASYGNPNFDVSREKQKLNALILLSNLMGGKKKPVIDPNLCVKCGICVDHCPVEGRAVNFKNGKENPPVYDYKKCIRCYCCQEICPQKAISVK